jgi:hypothetical protein
VSYSSRCARERGSICEDKELIMKVWIAGVALFGLSLSAIAESGETTRAADAALERERVQAMARDKASQEARARQQQEFEAGSKASMASDYRRALGKDADGKSDDEVIRLYREKEQAAGGTR